MRQRLQVAAWALDGRPDRARRRPDAVVRRRSSRSWRPRREIARAGVEVCDLAMQVAGGAAFFKGSIIERCYRDIRAAAFHPLTPEATLLAAGRHALGLPASERTRAQPPHLEPALAGGRGIRHLARRRRATRADPPPSTRAPRRPASGVALDLGLDAAVAAVAHPAGDAGLARRPCASCSGSRRPARRRGPSRGRASCLHRAARGAALARGGCQDAGMGTVDDYLAELDPADRDAIERVYAVARERCPMPSRARATGCRRWCTAASR